MSDFDSSRFDNGASYLMSDDSFKQYADGAVSRGTSTDAIVQECTGNSKVAVPDKSTYTVFSSTFYKP